MQTCRMMTFNEWCRLCLVQIVVLVIIIFTSMELDTVSFRRPPHLSIPLKEVMKVLKTPSLNTCKCLMDSWPGGEKIADHLLLSLPWRNTTTYQELQGRHPNLPLDLLYDAANKRCSLLPTIFSIEWENRLWQRATLAPNSIFSLYSAFFDPETDNSASIRVLAVSESKDPVLAWCHLWFSSDAPPQPVRISNIDYLDYQDKDSTKQMPFLLRCPLPPDTKDVPVGVSLVQEPCVNATNLLKVVSGRKHKTSTNRKVPHNITVISKRSVPAVCGPALFYYHRDFSSRLVEWLELLRAQGFGQVFLYITDVHPNVNKVLNHYTQEGFVQVTEYNYPPPYLNEPSLRRLWTLVERTKMFAQENVYFTDCVLRNMHQYRYLAHFDPDEMPILLKHNNITHFLNDLDKSTKKSPPVGYRLRMHYFYDNLRASKLSKELPTYLWMLRHNQREFLLHSHGQGGKFKPIFDTNVVRGVFSHGTLLCVSDKCLISKMYDVPLELGYYGHFKHTCIKKCRKDTIYDVTLLKYKEEVSQKVATVLKTLRLL